MTQSKIVISNSTNHNLNFIVSNKSNLIDKIVQLYLVNTENPNLSQFKYKITLYDDDKKLMEMFSYDKQKLSQVFNLLDKNFF